MMTTYDDVGVGQTRVAHVDELVIADRGRGDSAHDSAWRLRRSD